MGMGSISSKSGRREVRQRPFAFEHDLIGKPGPTFPDHAPINVSLTINLLTPLTKAGPAGHCGPVRGARDGRSSGLRPFREGLRGGTAQARRSPLTRRRPRCLTLLGAVALGATVTGLPPDALAQSQADVTAANRTTYFDGDPLDRRRFDPPKYGGATGTGAGKTGFDSTNARAKKTKKQARAALTAKRPASALPPAPAPTSPATFLHPRPRAGASVETPTAALPPGAEIYADGTVPPVTGSVARIVRQRRAVVAEVEPFDPLGLRIGAFVVKPAVELTGGHDSNVPRSPKAKASSFLIVAPELLAKSDWERHELSADLRGSYTGYNELPNFNRPNLNTKANARIDVSSQTRVDLEGRALLATDSPGDPNFPSGVSKPPMYSTLGMSGGFAHRFNRLELSVKGTFDRTKYEQSTLNDGSTLDNIDLNYRQYGTALRGSYEIGPGVKPFVEIAFDKREHDRPVDSSGVARDSNGMVPRIGTTFELSRKLTGEISAGYLTRHYQDPTLADLRGAVLDASLIWTASALTKATLTAKTTADESRNFGVSGILKRDIGLQVDHAFRQWLIVTGKVVAGVDEYQGSDRKDDRYSVSGLLTYKLNRNIWLKGELRQEWFKSNVPDSDYAATTFLLGLRFQQ